MKTLYFLAEDLRALEQHMVELKGRIRAIGQEMGDSCQEGAETFHDNFAHEEGSRQLMMWTRRLRELEGVRARARVVQPLDGRERVRIGSVVTVCDLETGQERTVQIGSFLVLSGSEAISYQAPLSRLLMGARQGETRSGHLAGRQVQLEVCSVHESRRQTGAASSGST